MSENKTKFKFKFEGIGLAKDEKIQAKKLFASYRKSYNIDNLSDLQLLGSLVFREILQDRYKKQIEELSKKQQEIIPKHLIESLDKNLAEIITIKDKLGLFEDKTKTDPFEKFKILRKKFTKWMEENQGSRTLACPHCSKTIMLKIRMDKWQALKHPFFQDKILANKELWTIYKEGKITKEEQAKILGVTPQYIDWLEEKIFKNDSDK